MNINRQHLLWVVPTILFILLTPFTPWLDLSLSQANFSEQTGTFRSGPFLDFMYHRALLPGQLLIAGSLIGLLLSYTLRRFRTWRKPALFLVLALAIGAGFITHAVLKDHWGRPRPKQVIAFGGMQEFRPIWKPNFTHQPEPSKSFPCGHCSMGFAFFAFYFLGKRLRKPWLSLLGLSMALILGVGLGITRIAQGGHFFSDVVATALIMWLTAYVFDWVIFEEESLT